MPQHSTPNIREFLRVLWNDWGTRMSGIFTVPFTIAAIVTSSAYGQAIFGTMAVSAFLITAYRIWADERRKLVSLELHLAPGLRIEFDPQNPKFLSPVRTNNGIDMLYLRVNARALSPVVRECRAYLTRISRWDGERYVSLFDEHLPMPWSHQNPNAIVPRELNRDVDALLDVAWFADPANEINRLGPFGFLNYASSLPNSLMPMMAEIFQLPAQNLKLDILVVATDSENAALSLNIHRGGIDWKERWNKPQVGWMDESGAIRRDKQ